MSLPLTQVLGTFDNNLRSELALHRQLVHMIGHLNDNGVLFLMVPGAHFLKCVGGIPLK